MLETVRLDRWLFAVRVFKTRSMAAKAIAGGKIKIDGQTVKAHRMVRIGDEVDYRNEGRSFRYKVTGLLEKRVGAKEAVLHYQLQEDPEVQPEVREMLKLYRELDKGTRTSGKPEKKDRRLLRKLKGED